MSQKIINCLYEYFKNSVKKLKIVCDWDEVIQSHEAYATWVSEKNKINNFSDYFKNFWSTEPSMVQYSPYGSKIKEEAFVKEVIENQQVSKTSSELYQNQPFLTIAKELLKLIKENKVEKIVFLSAYDKRKFPKGDERKSTIVKETFGKFPFCFLQLIGFSSESKGANKADWIKEHATDFDIVIDDNPYICQSIAEKIPNIKIVTPYYPNIAKQHHKEVLLLKTSVSDLKKENF